MFNAMCSALLMDDGVVLYAPIRNRVRPSDVAVLNDWTLIQTKGGHEHFEYHFLVEQHHAESNPHSL